MKSIVTMSVLLSAVMFGSCSKNAEGGLVGTWQTEIIKSEWGDNRITVTYLEDGSLAGTNAFLNGGSFGWHGTYRVRGNVIDRTIEGRLEEIAFRIEGDTMHQYFGGQDYLFRRKITKPSGPTNGSQICRSVTNLPSSAGGFNL